MTSTEAADLLAEIEVLRERLSMLGAASRRVGESLDLKTVIRDVIDSARYLTGAKYGAILTFDRSGEIQEFTSSGFSREQLERMERPPRGLGLLGHVSELRGPLRLADIASHSRSAGFPEHHPAMTTFLGMSIRHQGEHLGSIYLSEKSGGREFTSDDEDIVVMFAAQAGAALSNARRYDDERIARAELETLLNVSPVGVLVFDAASETLVSANDEVARMFGSLKAIGFPLERALEAVTLRRPDGSAIPVDETTAIRAIRNRETIIGEEVIIELPDGREKTALINARPMYRDDGEVISVVATIQDVTSLRAAMRQRSKFLTDVTHELRTPLAAIKGSTLTLLASQTPLAPDEIHQFVKVIDDQTDQMRHLLNDLVDMTLIEAGSLPVTPEPTDATALLHEAIEAHIHETGGDSVVELDPPPDLTRVMADRVRILQVLRILLANVSGYPSGLSTLRVSAALAASHLAITVARETSSHAASARLSQTHGQIGVAQATGARRSGRDELGLAICQGVVGAHGGRLSVGAGTDGAARTLTFTIPLVDDAPQQADRTPPASPSTVESEETGARILALSDDSETCRYLEDVLSTAGFRGVVTGRLGQVEQLTGARRPHLLLMDLTTSWTDGQELWCVSAHSRTLRSSSSPGADGASTSAVLSNSGSSTTSGSHSRRRRWWRESEWRSGGAHPNSGTSPGNPT